MALSQYEKIEADIDDKIHEVVKFIQKKYNLSWEEARDNSNKAFRTLMNNNEEIAGLLCSWEDGNMNDFEFCNKLGEILGLGNWTCKGSVNK
jgi:hypothetical protein